MTSQFDTLVDSDAFVGLFVEHDAHFSQAQHAFHAFASSHRLLVTTNLVITETASMLSRRIRYELACRFIEYIRAGNFPVLFIDKSIHEEASDIFLDQQQEKTSMVDCANVAVARYYNIPSILGFDKFYKKFGLELVR